MKIRNTGTIQNPNLTVIVSRAEVAAFRSKWPCSNLPDRAITFFYDHNGDLVDLHPGNIDGPDVVALCEDAWIACRTMDGATGVSYPPPVGQIVTLSLPH